MGEQLAKIANSELGFAFAKTVPGGLGLPMPFETKIVLHEDIIIAGTTHVSSIDDIVAKMKFPADIQLVRDIGNRYDAWAIKAFYEDSQVGFIPCDVNEVLARLMDGGKKLECTIREHERYGTWNRLHAEVSLVD